MTDIILYSNKLSRGRMVHWLLEELGVPYQIQWLDFGPAMQSEAFLAINPMGKVPALKHGEAIVTETAAILTYLADSFADKGLIPPVGTPARAAFYRWMFFIAGPLEAATSAAFLGWETPATTPRGTPGHRFLGYGDLSRTLDTLQAHLAQHAYVCGDEFTAADIYLASHLAFGMFYTRTYPSRPVFADYVERMSQRPAKQRAEAH